MKKQALTTCENLALTVLRMAIGWHFLYEGIAKIALDAWSSESYLANTTGVFSPFYHALASPRTNYCRSTRRQPAARSR